MFTYFIYSLISLILVYGFISYIMYLRHKTNIDKELKNTLKEKVWEIPVDLQCQYCHEISTVDFSLDTTHLHCPHCEKQSKILITFLTVAEDPTWKDQL